MVFSQKCPSLEDNLLTVWWSLYLFLIWITVSSHLFTLFTLEDCHHDQIVFLFSQSWKCQCPYTLTLPFFSFLLLSVPWMYFSRLRCLRRWLFMPFAAAMNSSLPKQPAILPSSQRLIQALSPSRSLATANPTPCSLPASRRVCSAVHVTARPVSSSNPHAFKQHVFWPVTAFLPSTPPDYGAGIKLSGALESLFD